MNASVKLPQEFDLSSSLEFNPPACPSKRLLLLLSAYPYTHMVGKLENVLGEKNVTLIFRSPLQRNLLFCYCDVWQKTVQIIELQYSAHGLERDQFPHGKYVRSWLSINFLACTNAWLVQ